MHKIICDFQIKTDPSIPAWRADRPSHNQQEEMYVSTSGLSCPSRLWDKMKESKKLAKELARIYGTWRWQ